MSKVLHTNQADLSEAISYVPDGYAGPVVMTVTGRRGTESWTFPNVEEGESACVIANTPDIGGYFDVFLNVAASSTGIDFEDAEEWLFRN